MKTLTKEWFKEMEYHDLIVMLESRSDKKIPLVFTNGGTEGIKDLHTVKTNLNLTDTENQIAFIMIPNTFEYYGDYTDPIEPEIVSYENDFFSQYINRLRIISYLTDDILKLVKDKRLLALGYAEEEVKRTILIYCKRKCNRAFKKYKKSCEASLNAETELFIHKQFIQQGYVNSLAFLFDEATITAIEPDGDNLQITVNDDETIVLMGASVLEEETSPLNSFVRAIELYKSENGYELHLLLSKKDTNLIDNFYYATYAFKDMKLKE